MASVASVEEAVDLLSDEAAKQGLTLGFSLKAQGSEKSLTNSEAQEPDSEVRRISTLPEFQKYAAENQWKERRGKGWLWNTNVFEFIQIVYGDWIERCKLEHIRFSQMDLREVDQKLYQRFQECDGKPDDLYMPTENQAKLDAITDPIQKQVEIEIRRRNAANIKASRSKNI